MVFCNIFLGMLGGQEIILIIIVLILLFGGRKIPELMKGIGEGIKEFRKSKSDEPESDSKSK